MDRLIDAWRWAHSWRYCLTIELFMIEGTPMPLLDVSFRLYRRPARP